MSAIFKAGVKTSVITDACNSGIQTAKGLLPVLHIKNTKSQTAVVSNTLQNFNKPFTDSSKRFSAKKIESNGYQQPQSYFLNPIFSSSHAPKPSELLVDRLKQESKTTHKPVIGKNASIESNDEQPQSYFLNPTISNNHTTKFTELLVGRLKQEIKTIHKSVISTNVNKDIQDDIASSCDAYASSAFSELLGRHLSNIDIFRMFLEIIRLYIKDNSLMQETRRQTILSHIELTENTINEINKMAKWGLFLGLSSSIFSLGAGLLPIMGALKGDSMLGAMQRFVPSLKNIDDPVKFFNRLGNISESVSKVYDTASRAHSGFGEGQKTGFQYRAELEKMYADEFQRRKEEGNQRIQELERMLKEALDKEGEADRQLFSI